MKSARSISQINLRLGADYESLLGRLASHLRDHLGRPLTVTDVVRVALVRLAEAEGVSSAAVNGSSGGAEKISKKK